MLPKCNDRQRILIADDEATNVEILVRIMDWAGFKEVTVARDGREAIDLYHKTDPDLVILDLHMPGKDGYEVLSYLRNEVSDLGFLPVLVYTADITKETREKALSLGATDFLTKPGEKTEIKLRVRNLLSLRCLHRELVLQNEELEQRVQERTQDLEAAQVEIVHRLALAGEYRDGDTADHTVRVGKNAALIAERLGLNQEFVATIGLAARLHDLGKLGVSDLVLLKPGRLSELEYEQMKAHTTLGASILANGTSPLLQMAERIALTHHERFDGTGYPNGIKGEDIPIEGRIVSVADVFDALIQKRAYKEAWNRKSAIAEIQRGSGTQFDPRVVQAFLQILQETGQAA